MLKLLDQNRIVQPPITNYSGLKIESVLDYDDGTLSFSIPISDADAALILENYIQTEDQEYVIKEKEPSNSCYNIVAQKNIEELEGTFFETFSSTEQTLKAAMDLALVGTGWTCICSLTKKRTLKLTNKYVWDIIKQAVSTYHCEVEIDSLNKVLTFVEELGEDKGVYFTSQLNLKTLTAPSNTYDFYTRILPLGKDGMTIESVNDGSKYLENHQYSNKVKTYFWQDERYTVPESLMEDAAYKLDDLSKPVSSYSCDVIDLANTSNEKYSILEYSRGDTITLIDEVTQTHVKQRIVKTTRYPDDSDNNTCEISNTVLSFAEYSEKYESTTETVDNITTDDGTVDGDAVDSLDANKLINVDEVIAKTASFEELNTDILNVAGEITAVSEKVGTLEATALTATTADLHYAKIDLTNIEDGSIKRAMIETGAISTAQIADASITSAKIIEITADIINGGTFNGSNMNVINLSCSSLTVGQINGTQIAPGSVDESKLTELLCSTISTTKEDLDNLTIGGENVLIASKTLVNDKYYIADNLTYNSEQLTYNGDRVVLREAA